MEEQECSKHKPWSKKIQMKEHEEKKPGIWKMAEEGICKMHLEKLLEE